MIEVDENHTDLEGVHMSSERLNPSILTPSNDSQANFRDQNFPNGLVAGSSFSGSVDTSQFTTLQEQAHSRRSESMTKKSQRSAREYLSDRQGDEKRIYKMILRSAENKAVKFKEFLLQSQGRLDVTSLTDR